jgi:amino acid permease
MTDNSADEATLASFGYKQELSRKLDFGSLWAVAFSTISITTGIVLNYGFGLESFGLAAIWTWPVAVVGQLFVAFVIAELGTGIPLAGYSYQWGRRLVGAGYGWLLGWTALLYMWAGGAAIALLVTAPTLASVFGWDESNGRLMLFLALALIVLALLINVVGSSYPFRGSSPTDIPSGTRSRRTSPQSETLVRCWTTASSGRSCSNFTNGQVGARRASAPRVHSRRYSNVCLVLC